MNRVLQVVMLVIVIVGLLSMFDIVKQGIRDVSALETIQGIPYPLSNGETAIQESLAHADIYLQEPVFAKNLELRMRLHPGTADRISVGIRENDFWLSYPKTVIWENGMITDWQDVFITVPLTDKIQDKDRSVDLMFFAENESTVQIENSISHRITWELSNLEASTEFTIPSESQIKDYVRSIIRKERPL